MFSGRVAATREEAQRIAVSGEDGWSCLCDAWEGSLPGTIIWDPHAHGGIPPGWRVVEFHAHLRVYEIAEAWHAPPLRIIAVTRQLGRWFTYGACVGRDWWRKRPRLGL